MTTTQILLKATVLLAMFGAMTGQGAGVPPRITEHPSDATVPRLSPVTLNCQAAGQPAPRVRWVKDGRRLASNAAHRVLLPRGSLFLLSVRRRDAGVYWCVAQNRHGTDISRNATLLVAVLREEFRAWPVDTEASVGDQVTLRCSPPRGDPPPTVRWLKDGSPLELADSRRYSLAGEGDLVIVNTTSFDAGDYVCEARNYAQMKRLSNTARLSVKARPRASGSSSDVTVLLGETVRLTCPLDGGRAAPALWRRPDGARLRSTARGHVITVTDVTAADGGLYECRAGGESATLSLTVHAPPQFGAAPRDRLTRPGSEVVLPCRASGHPPPVTFWTGGGRQQAMFPGFSAGTLTVHRNGSLHIQSARRGDEGLWSCFAVSEVGAAVARGYLWVGDPASDPATELRSAGGRARLYCPVTGGRVDWYRRDAPVIENKRTRRQQDGSLVLTDVDVWASGRYQCRAISPSGKVSSAQLRLRITTGAGADPMTSSFTLTSVVAVNSSALRLDIQERLDLGRVAELHVLYGTAPSGDFRAVRLAAERLASTVVSGLRPNTTYRFFLLPVMAAGGAGLPSNLLLQRTGIPTAVPTAAPDHLFARTLNASTALVSWHWPAGLPGGSAVRAFRLFLRRTDTAGAVNQTSFTVGGHSTQVTLHHLKHASQYSVRVAAETADGVGPVSAPLVFSLSATPSILSPPSSPPPSPPASSPPAGLLRQQWVLAALASLLGLLLLLALGGLLVCLHRRRRRRTLSRAVGEKRPEGLALLPSGVRPASWMEGAAWGAAKAPGLAQLSCRALPAFTEQLQAPPPPPRATLSPYATTALLDTSPQPQLYSDAAGVWSWDRAPSRESLPTFCRPASLKTRSKSSNVLLDQGHRPRVVSRASGSPMAGRADPAVGNVTGTGGDTSGHLYEALAVPQPNRPTSCSAQLWLSSASSACSHYSLGPGSELQSQPPRSRSFASAPRSARQRQKKAVPCVSATISGDPSLGCRSDPRDIYRQYEPGGLGTIEQ